MLGQLDVAIVIVADFGNNIGWRRFGNDVLADSDAALTLDGDGDQALVIVHQRNQLDPTTECSFDFIARRINLA